VVDDVSPELVRNIARGNLSLVLLIIAVSAKKWKTRRSTSYTLLFVGVVPSHIIANVCQGYFTLFARVSKHSYNDAI
jgi:hypothetical protein